jgi:hypothetical protein
MCTLFFVCRSAWERSVVKIVQPLLIACAVAVLGACAPTQTAQQVPPPPPAPVAPPPMAAVPAPAPEVPYVAPAPRKRYVHRHRHVVVRHVRHHRRHKKAE